MEPLRPPISVPETEHNISFLQAMIDRMGMSFHKYGPIAEAYPEKVDALACLIARLARYAGSERIQRIAANLKPEPGDGNTEWIADADNFGMIEFILPSHPKAHFRPTAARESPGRVWNPDMPDEGYEVSQRANDGTHQE